MLTQRPRAATDSRGLAFRLNQLKGFSRLEVGPLHLFLNSLQHAEHRVVLLEDAPDGRRGMDAQRLKFTHQQKSQYVVDIGIAQHHARNRRLADSFSRMQLRRGLDLNPQVRRRAEKKPGAAILSNSKLCLRTWFSLECARSHCSTIHATAIPLGKSATRR
jgi:hypothetical protein